MFDNIGGKIKLLAKIICWVGIIASVIIAIIMFISAEDADYGAESLYNTLGIVFLIGGPLCSWIGSFFAYGFGELIESSQDNAKYSNRIYILLQDKSQKKKTDLPKAEKVTHPDNSVEKTDENVVAEAIRVASGIKCSSCGFEQPSDRKVCWHCGKSFK